MVSINKQKAVLFWGMWLFLCVGLWAQNSMHVRSFKEDPTDLSARRHPKKDRMNGKNCALIKVITTQKGFTFDIGSSLVVESVEEKVAEVWVYVPEGTAKINIKHPHLGQLSDYEWFPAPLKAASTYRLELDAGKVEIIVKDDIRQQYLNVRIEPKDASLEINNEVWIPDANGVASKYVNFGEYNYRATAPMYHPAVGTVTVNDPDNPQELTLRLRPKYGFLQVDASSTDMRGALVYVDGERIGTLPVKTGRLESGTHRLRVVKELYKPYEQTVTISDSSTLTVKPVLTPNFAVTHLSVANNAEIWINGEKRGNGSWSGPLEAGTYRFETRKAGHRPAVQTELIQEESRERRITLRAPDPIYGSINITSQPMGAMIYIDGKEMGTTPRVVRNVLVGNRKVEIRKANHTGIEKRVVVEENKMAEVKAVLSNVVKVKVTTTNYSNYSSIYIDGKLRGNGPLEIELPCGTHRFEATYDGYKHNDWEGSTTVNVSEKTPVIAIFMKKLPRNYVKKTHFYIEGDFQAGGFMGYGGALGFYANRFNVEAGVLFGMSESDLYWYSALDGTRTTVSYTPMRIHLKAGYGIRCGRRIQLTPQIGLGYLSLSGDATGENGFVDVDGSMNVNVSYSGEGAEKLTSSYAMQWIGSLRMTWALASWCQLVLTPEYTGAINEGPLFEKASSINEDIKGWKEGFNFKAGFAIYF